MVAFRNFANASEKYKMVTPTQVLQFHSLTEEYEGSFNDESRTAKVVSLWNVESFLQKKSEGLKSPSINVENEAGFCKVVTV